MSAATTPARRWAEIALFLVLGFVAIGIPLVPMGLAANSIPFPDILFCLIVAWVIRRPSSAPMLVVALLAVLADALMMRTMGLWAFGIFVGTEVLRLSERAFRDIPFVLEWLYISILLALMLLLQNLMLIASFDDAFSLNTVVWHWVRSVAAYPLVVAVLHWGFRIRAVKKDKRPNRLGYIL